MSETVDIGAARVRLIVDAADFEPIIQQGQRAITGFGQVAQQAYDRTEKGTRRAADALLDYVNSLGRADTTMDRYIRTASRMGVEKPVLDAAITAWARHNDEVEQATIAQSENEAAIKKANSAYKELVATQVQMELQARKVAEAQAAGNFSNIQQARAANSQQAFNSALGVSTPSVDYERRQSAEAAFIELLNIEDKALADNAEHVREVQLAFKELMSTQQAQAEQATLFANEQAKQRIENLQQSRAASSQQAFNSLVAPGLNASPDFQKRMDAEAAFLPLITAQNKELETQAQLVDLIAQSRSAQNALTAQEQFNKLLGVSNSEQQQAIQLAQRRNDAMSAFLPQLEQEAKLESENTQLVARQQAFISELENTAKAAGKNHYQMLQLRADELGLGEAYAPLINKIKDQNQAMGAGTLSAKQYEFALRGLPAQFTDIVVSLQGGQRPLTVLLQQGGQIKDMFGGVGQAVKVVALKVKEIATSPLFVLAGVAALIGTAFAEASSRTTDFAVAAAKGNLIAGNAKGLSSLAEQLSKLNNISIGHADEAVQSLAAAGKLTGTNFALAAEAAARWATITGQSADTIIGKFNELANDPMQAVLDGTLKVTEAQYEQLAAFERTGEKAKEAQLAVKLYADQINNDSASVLANLSEAQKGWIDLKDAITDAWHSFTRFVTDAAGAAFNKLHAPTIGDLSGMGLGGDQAIALPDGTDQPLFNSPGQTTRSGFGGVGNDAATMSAIAQGVRLTTDQVNANKELQKSIDELGTKQQKFDAALTLEQGLLSRASEGYLKQAGIVKDAAGAFSGPGYDKLVNGLHLKFFGQTEGGDPTRPIKEWEKTTLDALKNVGQAQEYLYQQGSTDTKTYYAIQEGLARSNELVQLDAIEQQKAALKARNNPNDKAQLAQLDQQVLTVRETTAAAIAKLDHEELLAIQAKINAYHDYVQSLADANIALSRQGDQAAAAVGQGSREAGLSQAQAQAKYQADLRDRAAQDAVDALGPGDHSAAQAEADKKIAENAAALSTQLDILTGNYNSLTAAQLDWSNGASKAWKDWSDQVSNVAAQTNTLFTGMFNDLTNDLLNFVKTGHLSFKSFLDDAVTQIEKSGIQYALQQAFKYLGGSAAGGSGAGAAGSLFGLIGGLFGGGASAATAAGGDYSTAGLAAAFGYSQGGAFPAGTGLSSYRNSVVKSPTVFPFAKGGVPNVGVMGEKAGSPGEGIFPLARTSSGDLGVKVVGNNQRPAPTINQTFVVPGAVTRQTQDQLAIKQFGAARRASSRN